MGLDDILSVFRAQKRINDDIIDRLSHHWTVLILAIFVIITSTSQYAGDPIHCWCPAEFSDAYVDYAEAACWVKNTYYIPIGEEIPLLPSQRKDAEIQYYQWVPIILAFQALLFKLPYIFWKMLNKSVGINIDKVRSILKGHLHDGSKVTVVKLADNTAVVSSDDRKEAISNLANCVKRWLDNSKQQRRHKLFKGKFSVVKWCFWNKHSGRCLIFLYLITKLLYLLNAISQFFLLDAFMGYSFHNLGIDFFSAASKEEGFKGISRFPRTTLCDFKIRQLSNIQTWTVQCILSVNLFSERIFVSVWFILVFVSIFTACGIFKWIRDTFYVKTKESFVRHYLKVHDQIHDDKDKKLLKKFLSSFLGFDGLFVLRIVSQNSSEIFTGDLILRLWKEYKHPENNLANGDLDIDKELKMNGMGHDPDKRADTL